MTPKTDELTAPRADLVHLEGAKVISHVQRTKNGRYLNSLIIDGFDTPFKYKRQQRFKSLEGRVVNVTYYPSTERVAGMDFEIMRVVRVQPT